MICVYDPLTNDFSGNGKAVLMPTSGTVKMVAGGDYSFTMEHPIDPWGKWKFLKEEAIVRLPVPKETIENSFSGVEADIYKTNQDAELRDDTSEPETISYTSWSPYTTYSVGSNVTYAGKNYKCTYWDGASYYSTVPPGPNNTWWQEIARTTNGATVIASLPSGSELYFVEDVDGTWYKMSTYYGVQGYIKKSKVTFDHHSSQTENEPRTITEQLFRIREVSVDRDNGKVSVSGKHVSYDLNGDLVEDMTISQASAAMAISRVMENLAFEYRGTIATNISSDEDTTFSGTFKMKNGMHCLIDPDAGIVPTFNAKFTRDNWDLFVMENDSPDKGLRIRYGKNVNGITWKRKTDGLVTRVIPKAKDADGGDLFLPERWVDSEHILEYQVIYMEYLSVSGQVGKDDGTNTDTTWTEEALLDEMRQKALDRFEVDEADKPVTEITVQFEPLERTDEFRQLRGLMTVNLYDLVHVEDPEIGLEAEVKVSEIEYNYVARKITGIKLSNVTNATTRTVTGYNITNGSIGSEKLKDDVITSTVEQAMDNAQTVVKEMDVTVVDNLSSTSSTAALSANQGRVLDGKIPEVIDNLSSTSVSKALSAKQGKVLNEKKADLIVLSNVSGNSSKSYTVANSSRVIVMLTSQNDAVNSLLFIGASTTGALTVTEIRKGSGITITTGTRTLTIQNTTSNAATVNAFVMAGSISDAT